MSMQEKQTIIEKTLPYRNRYVDPQILAEEKEKIF